MAKEILISVVIATRNEAQNIPRIVDSTRNQSFKNWEVILVDNSDDDSTMKAVKKAGLKKIFRLRKKDGMINFRGAQVNLGVKKSRGEIIFFPDADMTFDRDLFKEISKKYEDYDALYIPEVVMGVGFFSSIRRFERSFYDMTVVDAVRVVKRSVFDKVDGFDVENIAFGADDWDLTKRIKKVTGKIGITKNRLYHHEGWLNWKTYIEKKSRYVDCFEGYVKKWGNGDADVQRQLGLKYRAFGVFLENGKWKRFLSRPNLALGMYGLRLVTWLAYQYGKTN